MMELVWRMRRSLPSSDERAVAARTLLQHMGQEAAALQIKMLIVGFVARSRTRRTVRLLHEAQHGRRTEQRPSAVLEADTNSNAGWG